VIHPGKDRGRIFSLLFLDRGVCLASTPAVDCRVGVVQEADTLISLEELVDRFLKVVFSVKSKRSGRVGGVW